MGEDFLTHRRIFNTGNHHRTAGCTLGLDVIAENPSRTSDLRPTAAPHPFSVAARFGPTPGIGFKLWILVSQSAIRDRPKPRITRGFALLPPDYDVPWYGTANFSNCLVRECRTE
jgi:hypothetical protein